MSALFDLFLSLNVTTKYIMIAIWTIVIIGSIIIETETSELVSCWFALSGLVCLVLAVCNVDLLTQCIVFVVVSALLVIATRPLIKKFNSNENIPTNSDKLIGMIGVVSKKVVGEEKGEIKVNYQKWTAISKCDEVFEVGEKALVRYIDGNKLIIEKINEIEIK